MAWEDNSTNSPAEARDAFRDPEQKTEAGSILLSARAVSRQMVAKAQTQAEEIVREAEAQAAETLRKAEEQAAARIREAAAQAEEIVCDARQQAARIISGEEPFSEPETAPAAETVQPEEERPPEADTASTAAQLAEAEARAQEYAARCVEACLSELRQRQLENIDYINDRWQQFLCGLLIPEEAETEAAAPEEEQVPQAEAAPEAKSAEIDPHELEEKVQAIARELMDIIGR